MLAWFRNSIVCKGSGAIATALGDEVAARRRLVVLDAVTDEDLVTIGEAVVDHKLVTGGSGIALGLPANFRAAGLLSGVAAILARGLIERGVTRLVVGGGETAGAAVTALGLRRFEIGPEIDPGVPALAAGGSLRLALKSGNFGGVDFYTKIGCEYKPRGDTDAGLGWMKGLDG